MNIDTDSRDHLNTPFLELALDFYQDSAKFLPLGKQVIGLFEPYFIDAHLFNGICNGNAKGQTEAIQGREPTFYRQSKAQVEILALKTGPVPTSSPTTGRLAVR